MGTWRTASMGGRAWGAASGRAEAESRVGNRGGMSQSAPPRPRFLLIGSRVAGSRLSRKIQKSESGDC